MNFNNNIFTVILFSILVTVFLGSAESQEITTCASNDGKIVVQVVKPNRCPAGTYPL